MEILRTPDNCFSNLRDYPYLVCKIAKKEFISNFNDIAEHILEPKKEAGKIIL